MAAPIPSSITQATDTSYTGKQMRTQQKTVSGQPVLEEFYVPSPAYTMRGHYFFSSPVQTALANAQDGISTGFYFFLNPVGSTTVTALSRISLDMNKPGGSALTAAIVISFTKFTFTGATTPTDLPVIASKIHAQPQMVISTNSTGSAITPVGDIGQAGLLTAQSVSSPMKFGYKEVLPYNAIAYQRGFRMEFAAGEGLSVWQSTAGSLGEARKFWFQVEWDEFDLA